MLCAIVMSTDGQMQGVGAGTPSVVSIVIQIGACCRIVGPMPEILFTSILQKTVVGAVADSQV